MRSIIFICGLFFCLLSHAQEDQLAKDYFKRGEFEKALLSYQKLFDANKGNTNYFLKIIEIHQQLEQLDVSEKLLLDRILKSRNPQHIVDLGYNFHLKNNNTKADSLYQVALTRIEEKPVYGYYIARRFENYSMLDYTVQAYETTMSLRPEANYSIQLARIYGEQGNVEKMFSSYVDFIETNEGFVNRAKRAFSDYISEHGDDENNLLLRKVLLQKMQSQPNIIWNQLLSWLYIQQKDYGKAFAQEKAIFKRQNESLQGIIDIAYLTIEEQQAELATEILNYLIENAFDLRTVINAHENILELEILYGAKENYPAIEQKYKSLLEAYGSTAQTIELQLSYAHFMAFYLNNPKQASQFLREALNSKLPKLEEAKVKLKLGDILVFQEKFNEALIYYTQIQRSLKNSIISQEARFKVAKTSYYKGDFQWAESQLKILKASTSQLIANDALDLKLLISDNKFEDSTQTALKLYAKADLYAYQNKNDEAIDLLDQILENHKTESIVDQALYQQAQLFEKKKEYHKAQVNYQFIIDNYGEEILADDAYFALAELNSNHFNNPEEAKILYEQIIFNHADSIYFVEARKKYRALRGDVIN